MSTKRKCILFSVITLILIAAIGFLCWWHVDGTELPLPESDPLSGAVTRVDIGFDADSATATHDTEGHELTQAQIDTLLQLLRQSSYRRTGYGSSVSFDGDVTYAISLAYRLEGRNEIVLITVLDNALIHILVDSETSSGYLRIIDPDFLTQLQAILEN